MTARTGMAHLILRLREMTETSATDYTVNGVQYWTDDQLQNKLDVTRQRMQRIALASKPDYRDGEFTYTRYEIPRKVGNAVEAGTTNFEIVDSNGTALTGWVFDANDLSVTFSADQEGKSIYWNGYRYDMPTAAREVWLIKAAHVWDAIDFKTDSQSFSRSALNAHCLSMARVFGYTEQAAVTLQSARLVRADVNRGREPQDGSLF